MAVSSDWSLIATESVLTGTTGSGSKWKPRTMPSQCLSAEALMLRLLIVVARSHPC